MTEDPVVLAHVTVTPVGTEDADISDYVRRCVQVAHLSELNFEETPLGVVVRGPLDEIMRVVRKMHEAPIELGADRVRTSVTIDDYRNPDSEESVDVAARARQLQVQDEPYNP